MSGTTLSSDGLSVRKRRVLFRAWHRGTREMDLLFGRFADAVLPGMDDADLAEMERLIEVPDHELFAWVTGKQAVPEAFDTPVLRALCTHHERDGHDG